MPLKINPNTRLFTLMDLISKKLKIAEILHEKLPQLQFETFDFHEYLAHRILAAKKTSNEYFDQSNLDFSDYRFYKILGLFIPDFKSIVIILHYCLTILFRLRRSKCATKNLYLYSLTKEQINAGSPSNNIEEFIRLTFPNSRDAKIIIQSPHKLRVGNSSNISCRPFIATSIVANSNIKTHLAISFIYKQIKEYLKLLNKNHELGVLGIETFIEILCLEKKLLSSNDILITTQSQLKYQPLIFCNSKCKKYMLWYSENSRPISSKTEKKLRNELQDFVSISYIQKHLVWTTEFANYLEREYRVNCEAVGPILFYRNKSSRSANPKDLLIFDVTPFENAKADSVYSSKNMLNFISDILSIEDLLEIEVQFLLKPKRKLNSRHAIAYKNYLKELKATGDLKFCDPNSDLFELVNSAKLVICVPFTSPALIAKELVVPVVYYYPTENFEFPSELNGIKVIIGRENLRQVIRTMVYK